MAGTPGPSSSTDSAHHAPPAFADIAAGIDGSRRDRVVAEQAAALADGEAKLTFVTVTAVAGTGPTAMTALGPDRAREALAGAKQVAAAAGTIAFGEALRRIDVAPAMLEEAERHDLLVVGAHTGSRAGGIFLGSTSSALVHRATVPVLVARPAPAGTPFPQKIVVASDGSDGSRRATELAARIARRHGATVMLLHAGPDVDAERRHAMAEEATVLAGAMGVEPVIVNRFGPPAKEIVAVAGTHGASLVVIGSRGRTGLTALGSVSERVVHAAPCSVLVARP